MSPGVTEGGAAGEGARMLPLGVEGCCELPLTTQNRLLRKIHDLYQAVRINLFCSSHIWMPASNTCLFEVMLDYKETTKRL